MAIRLGKSVLFEYRYQAVAMPASASQKGSATKPCAMNASSPWNSPSTRGSASLKKSP